MEDPANTDELLYDIIEWKLPMTAEGKKRLIDEVLTGVGKERRAELTRSNPGGQGGVMNKPNLDAIRKRVEVKSKGRWSFYGRYNDRLFPFSVHVSHQGEEKTLLICREHEDADFIAHAPTDIKALLEYVEALEKVREAAGRHFSAVIAYETALCEGPTIEEHNELVDETIAALEQLGQALAACEEKS